MKIPEYPLFRLLDLSDKAVLDAAFTAAPPENSEYTFTNLYAWRNAHDFHIARFGHMLMLRSEKKGSKDYYPPIGSGDAANAVKMILSEPHSRFVRVPENMMPVLSKDDSIKAVDDRDNADYVFLTKELIDLAGRKYDGKRNFIRKFKSTYRYEYIPLAETDVPEVLRFQDIWCFEKGCSQSKSLQDESEAVKIMLANLRAFSLKAGALRVNGKICAVCIAEALNPGTFVIHALKGAQGLTGIYQTMFNDFLSREAAAYQYVNMEQDLGVMGLRKSKESYQPVRLIKKFTLYLSGEGVK